MPVALPRTGPRPWTSALRGMWISPCSGSCTQILHQGKEAPWWGRARDSPGFKDLPPRARTSAAPPPPVCKYKRIPVDLATASSLQPSKSLEDGDDLDDRHQLAASGWWGMGREALSFWHGLVTVFMSPNKFLQRSPWGARNNGALGIITVESVFIQGGTSAELLFVTPGTHAHPEISLSRILWG